MQIKTINKKDYGVLFLQEFTKELILNSKSQWKFIMPFHPVLETANVNIIPEQKPIMPVIPAPPRMPQHPAPPIHEIQNQVSIPEIVSPSPMPLPANFNLGKLNNLISDNRITSIECSGPGKPILVRSLGRVSSAQTTLGEEDIKNVIESFAQAAKIPFIGGVFKAAVGNLVITAVISDFVGSRFIINKYTPYSILEQNNQKQQFQPQSRQ